MQELLTSVKTPYMNWLAHRYRPIEFNDNRLVLLLVRVVFDHRYDPPPKHLLVTITARRGQCVDRGLAGAVIFVAGHNPGDL